MAVENPRDALGDNVHGVDPWLERNADVVEIEAAREERSQSWERATSEGGQANITHREGLGRYNVELPDGEEDHEALLVKADGSTWVGACNCDGYQFHGRCAHLCTLAQRDVLENIVPRDKTRAEELAFNTGDVDADVVEHDQEASSEATPEAQPEANTDEVRDDHADGQEDVVDADPVERDDVQEASAGDLEHGEPAETSNTGPSKPNAPVRPQGSDAGNQPATPVNSIHSEVDLSNDPLEVLPKWMKSEIQQRDGDVALNKRGCQVIKAALNLEIVEREFIERARDTDFEYAVCDVKIRSDALGITETATGEAHIKETNVEEDKIDRMAETRAKKRAIKSISGGGILAFVQQ